MQKQRMWAKQQQYSPIKQLGSIRQKKRQKMEGKQTIHSYAFVTRKCSNIDHLSSSSVRERIQSRDETIFK